MILSLIGTALLLFGLIFDIFGAVGMHRFDSFYLRIHAATLGTIGGKFYPFVGVALIAFDRGMNATAGIALAMAFILLIASPIGAHALVYAGAKTKIVDIEHNEFGDGDA
ncbi:monovalent cation/H(+) antiporter subunit G [Thermococcus barophilus]|uniref:Membrane bound subgroup 4b [NiFe]-hydrogenase MBH(B)1, subunit Mbh(B)1C n=1 Tax=Thermococcus barophilus TaxID=55802 RepID=A0A0S1XA20_THEBA|nr:monovalent cation/H(+) antiporter subunit G [Thermococcus barophilus]ALM74610.1 Membrane bound subgroup 4b [NiFe]-hydrogenase MBH(b)1, subunit Mbh(b)1C [Thermococcus barophilus]